MSEPIASTKPSRRRRVVIAGVVIGVAVMLLAATRAAVVWWRVRQARQAAETFGLDSAFREATSVMVHGLADGGKASEQFVTNLRAGRLHDAYQATSRQFREKMSEAGFEAFAKDRLELKAPSTSYTFNVTVGSPGTSIKMSGNAAKDSLWLHLISEDGALKVDQLAIGDKTAP